jgi:hypothetical protein
MVNTQTIYTPTNSAALYLVKQADDHLLILPADDRVEPLLGYTDAPAEGQMPEQLQWWLNEYARQIQYLQSQPEQSTSLYISQDSNTAANHAEASSRTAISPMVTTHWNQDAPYNNQCPTIGGVATYTGCVATAAAQLMNYNKYPTIGTGSISYTDSYKNSYSMDFTKQEFDWANMLNSYSGSYTDAQANAVAYLMKAVGHAAQMNYGTSESGANSTRMADALKTYFSYNDALEICYRDYFTLSDWEDLIYNNLKTVGPVYYAGDDTSSGHAFVCDGYSDGYFHFNWGWGGSYDGYFQLTALLPQGQGIGGNAGGYNFGQEAILNITSPTHATEDLSSVCPLYLRGNLQGEVKSEDGYIYLALSTDDAATVGHTVTNLSSETHTFDIYLTLTNTDDQTVYHCTTYYSASLPIFYGYSEIDVYIDNIPAGTYKAELTTTVDDGTQLYPLSHETSCTNYIYVTINDNEELETVSNVSGITPTIGNISLGNKIYWGKNFKFSFSATNNSDTEYYYGIYPAIVTVSDASTESTKRSASATMIAKGNALALDLLPNETKELTFVSSMTTGSTSYSGNAYFCLISTDTNSILDYEPITVNAAPSSSDINATQFELVAEDLDNVDATNLTFNCGIKCTSGIYYEPIHVYLVEQNATSITGYLDSAETFFLDEGDTASATVSGSYASAEVGKTYEAILGYVVNHTVKTKQSLTFTVGETVSAIEELNADEADKEVLVLADRRMGCILVNAPATIAKIEVYGLDGRMVYSETNVNDNSASFAMNHKGLNIVKVTLTDGTNIVRKVAL